MLLRRQCTRRFGINCRCQMLVSHIACEQTHLFWGIARVFWQQNRASALEEWSCEEPSLLLAAFFWRAGCSLDTQNLICSVIIRSRVMTHYRRTGMLVLLIVHSQFTTHNCSVTILWTICPIRVYYKVRRVFYHLPVAKKVFTKWDRTPVV